MRKTKTTKLTCTPGRPSFPGNPISPFCRVHKHCPWINNNTACKFEKFHNIFLSLTEPNLISNWNGSLPLFLPLTTQLVVDGGILSYIAIVSPFSNFVQPPNPNFHFHYSFCCLVSFTDWVIEPHLMSYFTNDIMDLHISSLGNLLRSDIWHVFFALHWMDNLLK